MTIEFRCPSGHRLRAPDRKAGKRVRCPVCRQHVVVPEPSDDSGAPAKEAGRKTPVEAEPVPGLVPPPLPNGPATAGPESRPPGEPGADRAKRRRSRAERKRRRPKPGELAGGAGPPASKPPRPRRRPKSTRNTMPPDVCRPDRGKIQTVKWLAFILGLVVLMGAAPAAGHANLESAPGWARLVLLMAAIEVVFIAWTLAAPDWSTVWVLMLVFAAVSTVYGAATAVSISTPPDHPMPLGLGDVRLSAPRWCMAMLLTSSLATYLCGRISTKWRRQFELDMAGKGRRS